MLSVSQSYCQACKRQADPGQTFAKCKKCSNATYCSKECQMAHWPLHKPICTPPSPGNVWAIRILSNRGVSESQNPADYFRHERVGATHGIFKEGQLCPVTRHIGIPLIIYRDTSRQTSGSNEIAVKLRVEATDGFAPPVWLLGPGECIVMREDRKPLTIQLLETIYSFNKHLMSYPIIDEGWAPWHGLLNPSVWQFYAKKYYEEQDADYSGLNIVYARLIVDGPPCTFGVTGTNDLGRLRTFGGGLQCSSSRSGF